MLRALLFDFNGVLVDDEPIHYQLFAQVLAEEGLELSEPDYYEHYLGFDDRGCFRAVLERAGQGAGAPRLMRLIARKASYYQERIRREGYPLFPGALELVRGVAEQSLMLGLVSGALREEVEGALRQMGVRQRFKVLVTAEDVERGKPDPEGYLKALEGLNALPPLPERLLHPHEVVVLEDSPAGLQAAAEAGLRTVAVAHTYPAEELSAAEVIVETLGDIPAGDLDSLLDRGRA